MALEDFASETLEFIPAIDVVDSEKKDNAVSTYLVIEGRMLINIEGKEIILNQGDSIYFNSKLPHGMKALDGKTVRFLAVIM